jgi:hypothetical protein
MTRDHAHNLDPTVNAARIVARAGKELIKSMSQAPPPTRRGSMQFGLGISIVAATCAALLFFFRPIQPSVVNDALVGWTESEVIAEFGNPDKNLDGYERLGTETRPVPAGPVRTLIYSHQNKGTLWVWLKQSSDGQWSCFESCWFAAGVRF